jgi:hypothetical protein
MKNSKSGKQVWYSATQGCWAVHKDFAKRGIFKHHFGSFPCDEDMENVTLDQDSEIDVEYEKTR